MTSVAAGLMAELDFSSLQSPPQIIRRLLQELERDQPERKQLAALLACDPALCARVLSAAAASGELAQSAQSLEASVDAIGLELLRALALNAAATQLSAEPVGAFDAADFWRDAVLAAELCRLLSDEAGLGVGEAGYLAGLLHNIGQALLSSAPAGTYATLLNACDGEQLLVKREQDQLGTTHAEVGAELVAGWRAVPFVADAIRYHHHPLGACEGAHPLVRLVRTACVIAEESGGVHTVAALLGLPIEAMTRCWGQALQRVERLSKELGIESPGDKAEIHDANDVQSILRIDGPTRPAPGAAPNQTTEAAQLQAAFSENTLRFALKELFVPCRNDDEVLRKMVQACAGLLGLSGALFFSPEESHAALRGQGVDGRTELADQLRVPLDPAGNAIACAYVEGRPTRMADKGAPLKVIDHQVLRVAQSPGILCIPLLASGKAVGVLAARIGNRHAARDAGNGGLIDTLAKLAGEALHNRRLAAEPAGEAAAEQRYQANARRLAHETGNPLGIIRNYLGVLAARPGADNATQEQLRILDKELERVSRLIRQFADAPSGVARRGGLVDINTIAREMVAAYAQALFGARQMGLELALDPVLPPIQADEDAIRQVLLNLIKNAAEAMSAGGRLVIGTMDNVNHAGRNCVAISVRDNGPGIPAETMQRLFQPAASSKAGGHQGLGLAVVLSQVQKLGGTVLCRSQLGQGTLFQILLPRVIS